MKTTDERLDHLEKLLSESIADSRVLRHYISDGFQKIDENFELINKHFGLIQQKIEKVDKKIDDFSGKTDKNIKNVNLNLVSIKEEIAKINTVTGYEEEHNNLKIVSGE